MNAEAVIFENVGKSFPFYSHFTGGLKNLLLHFRKSLSSFRNSRFEALRDISFTIHRGESFGIIGRNGAGKSTILGLIAGVLRPSIGHVEVRGRISPFLELGAGFHPELTGRDNIMLNGVLMGLSRTQVAEQMDEIIQFSELGRFIDQPIRVYSSGMLSRLGFSVVAHLNPEILLVDEVLAVGDIDFEKKCIEKMQEFKKKGVTIVLVSHSMKDVEEICSRVAWIEDHTVKMLGDAASVVPAYVNSWAQQALGHS